MSELIERNITDSKSQDLSTRSESLSLAAQDLSRASSDKIPAAATPAGQGELQALSAATQKKDTILPDLILSDMIAAGTADANSRSVIVVDKTHHKTHILQFHHGEPEDVLTVPDATGKRPGSTPEGRFQITAKELHPTWYPPESIGGSPIGPGPNNPLGPAKIRTSADGGLVLLHGTSRPDQIGTNASHGCIRHNNSDILRIYPLVHTGDALYIVKNFAGTHVRVSDFNP